MPRSDAPRRGRQAPAANVPRPAPAAQASSLISPQESADHVGARLRWVAVGSSAAAPATRDPATPRFLLTSRGSVWPGAGMPGDEFKEEAPAAGRRRGTFVPGRPRTWLPAHPPPPGLLAAAPTVIPPKPAR